MILIIGSTGVLGRETSRQLLEAGHNVRAMTRNPESADDLKKLGAEVMQGDLIDKASLERACKDVDSVLAAAHQLMGAGKYKSEAVDDEGHRVLIDVAKSMGVKQFVYTSAQHVSPNHPTDFYRAKFKIEEYLKASGLSYTILRPSAFMEWHAHNLLGKSILETGKVTIFGGGNNPMNFIAGKDAARFAVIALTDPKAKNRTLEIGGPDNETKNKVAEMYGKYSGRTPKVTNVPAGFMRFMSPILRPFQPVISRLMALSAWTDTSDQTFNAAAILKEFPITLVRLEDFIQAQATKKL